MAQVSSREQEMANAPIGKLMLRMSLPAVMAQLINVLYNVVDRIYIGHIPEIGALALTGVGVTFPILMIIAAFSAFAGMGGAPLASIKLGAGDREGAERILGSSVTMLLCLSAVLTATFIAFSRPLLFAFGASENIIGYAMDYIGIYVLGTVFVQFSLGLNTYISAQGQATTAMLSVLIGAVINIALDPLFIFALGMGVKGAALATIISQACSAVWVVRFLCGKKSSLRIRTEYMKPDFKIIGRIAGLGIAPFIMQSTESFVTITINSNLQAFGGDLYVGSMTVLQSVMQMIMMPMGGVSQGCQPIISFNYGAKNYDRARKCFANVLKLAMTVMTVCCIVVVLLPGVFARIFTPDEQLVALVEKVMPLFFAGIWIFGAQLAGQCLFMGLGQAKLSLFLALLRKVFLMIPLVIILPRAGMGVMGVYWAEPIADITAASICILLLVRNLNRLLPKNGEGTHEKEIAE